VKLPFIKFFPRDWQADSNLRVCSLEERGLWFEMLCIMAQAPRYGYLTNGDGKTPLSDDALTRLIGCSKDDLYRAKAELAAAEVPSIESPAGVWFNRRMVREEIKRLKCSEAGRAGGGNPALRNTDQSLEDQKPEARSHISIKAINKDDLYRADFEEAWKAYPDKSGKTKAYDAYKKHRADGDDQADILAGIDRYKAYVAAKRAKGQDLGWRNGQTFFNQANWRDEWVVADLPPVIAQTKKTADTQKVITFTS
jgi:hypothetical protein